jgi:hypothetical protein
MTQPTPPVAAEAHHPPVVRSASAWYDRWVAAWNSHDPEQVRPLVTEDFVLLSPTSTQMGWEVHGVDALVRYVRFVIGAYPDLTWRQTGAAMHALDVPRVAFTWRGTGTFTGRMDPPGIDGTGLPFAFTGVEIFDFRDDLACALEVAYDLQGLMRQVLPRSAA